MTKPPGFARWYSMVYRCRNPKASSYKYYGARGINVCDRWMFGEDGKPGIQCFSEDMGPGPPGLSLDRIDNDGNYEPANCRWATQVAQAKNRRRGDGGRARSMAIQIKLGSLPVLRQAFEKAGIEFLDGNA